MKKNLRIGDIIPLDQVDKFDIFYLVMMDGQKYLVDKKGGIVLTPREKLSASGKTPEPAAGEKKSAPDWPQPGVEALRFRTKPGTAAFSEAVVEAADFVDHFLDLVHKHYHSLAPRFEVHLDQTHTPYIKYWEYGRDGPANMMAHLIRDFFSRTTMGERGLEIFEFLTILIARKVDGNFSRDRELSDDRQKSLVVEFLHFLGDLGDTPVRKRILAKTYRDFISHEFEIMDRQGGVGNYIISSLHKALEKQRVLLISKENQNYLDSVFQRLLRRRVSFCLDNILAYLKALAIVRFIANSRKEERGRDDAERERLLYTIIAYNPG